MGSRITSYDSNSCEHGVPFVAALRVDHVPLARNLAETVLLVGVVHVGRPGLHVGVVVERLEEAVIVGDGAEAQPRGVDRVHLRDAQLCEVGGAAEAELVGFVEERLHDFGRVRHKLDPVNALIGRPANPFARLLRGADGAAVPALPGALVDEHARGGDLVVRAALALGEREVHRGRTRCRGPR